MCDVEEWPVISVYSRQQAVEDGILVELFTHNGMPVMATSNLYKDSNYQELCAAWKESCTWKKYKEPKLKEEDKLFHMSFKGKKVWVIEDAESYTLMYPEDY